MAHEDEDGEERSRTLTQASETEPTDADIALQPVDPCFYALGAEHARGGLGRILSATDRRLGRPVAIKELLRKSPNSMQRFVREARMTARLQHPAIVPVHEAGLWPDGSPFYTMKFVEGRSLKELIQAQRDLPGRLSLLPNLIAVAEAVAFAHSKRIIHRDLKPSNVVVGAFGETVVVDWGLAKDISPEADDDAGRDAADAVDPSLTTVGTVVGTPAYMPPEQARGEAVDARADVYALGAMAYHLLAGNPPFAGSSDDVLRRLQEGAPPPLQELQDDLAPDLVAIVSRAMAREPGDRYPDASSFAEDLRRYQTGQLVAVHRYGLGELLRRWMRRHRGLSGAVAAFFVLSMVGAIFFLSREGKLRRAAEAQRDFANAQQVRADAERERADEQTTTLLEERGREELLRGRAHRAAVYFSEALVRRPDREVYRWLTSESVRTMDAIVWLGKHHRSTVSSLSVPTSEEQVLSTGFDGLARLLDIKNGRELFLHNFNQPVLCGAISSDGNIAIFSLIDGSVERWSLTSKKRVDRIHRPHDRGRACAISRNGDRAAVIYDGGATLLWTLDTGGIVRTLPHGDHTVGIEPHVAFSHDGSLIITGMAGGARLWNSKDGTRLGSLPDERVTAMAFSPDDEQVYVASASSLIRRWNVHTRNVDFEFRNHTDIINSIDVSADRVVTTDARGIVFVWSPGGRNLMLQSSEDGIFTHARYIATDKLILALDNIGRISLFDLGGNLLFQIDQAKLDSALNLTALLPETERIVLAFSDGSIGLIDPKRMFPQLIAATNSHIYRIAYTDSEHIACTAESGSTFIVNTSSRTISRVYSLPHGAMGWRVEAARASDYLAVSSFGLAMNAAAVLDTTTFLPITDLGWQLGDGYGLAISPDGRTLVLSGQGRQVRFFDALTGQEIRDQLKDGGQALAFHPSGSMLAIGHSDIRLFSWPSMDPVLTIEGHPATVIDSLHFDSRGERILSAGWDDHTANIWDARTGAKLVALTGHNARLMAARFSPDGALVVTTGFDWKARVWDSHSGELLRTIRGPTHGVDFSPDSKRLATAIGGRVLEWDLNLDPRSPAELERYVASRTPWHLVEGRLMAQTNFELNPQQRE